MARPWTRYRDRLARRPAHADTHRTVNTALSVSSTSPTWPCQQSHQSRCQSLSPAFAIGTCRRSRHIPAAPGVSGRLRREFKSPSVTIHPGWYSFSIHPAPDPPLQSRTQWRAPPLRNHAVAPHPVAPQNTRPVQPFRTHPRSRRSWWQARPPARGQVGQRAIVAVQRHPPRAWPRAGGHGARVQWRLGVLARFCIVGHAMFSTICWTIASLYLSNVCTAFLPYQKNLPLPPHRPVLLSCCFITVRAFLPAFQRRDMPYRRCTRKYFFSLSESVSLIFLCITTTTLNCRRDIAS